MALITIVGFPCAGKSSRTAQLKDFLVGKITTEEYTGPIKNVQVISDHSLGITPSAYNGSSSHNRAVLPPTFFQTALQKNLLAARSLLIFSDN